MHSIKHTRGISHEFPRKSLEIKQNEDFFSKLLSKELYDQNQNSKITSSSPSSLGAESSFRVYYGATGNVPFLWESTPGTPKHKTNDSSVPPLTPPPPFSYSKSKSQISRAQIKFSSSRIFSIISLPKLNTRRSNSYLSPTSASSTPNYSATSLNSLFSSSPSSSSSLSPESTLRSVRQPRRRSIFSRRHTQMLARDMDDDREGQCDVAGAPKSRRFVCFGGGPSSSRRNGSYTVKNMKKTLSSVVGHRSSGNVIYMA